MYDIVLMKEPDMIKHVFLLCITVGCFLLLSACPQTMTVQDLQVSEDRVITTTMMVGNLTISGDAILEIDYRSEHADTFVVVGNITVEDSAQLIIRGNNDLTNDGFIIANEYNSQRLLKTTGTSKIQLENIIVRTQTGTAAENGSVYMNYEARDNSSMIINGAILDNESSWLLGNFRDNSTLQATNTRYIPTEIYLNDSCDVSISGTQTSTGLWLALTSGPHTINLPDVSADVNWTWDVSDDIGAGVKWHLAVSDADPGMGIQLYPDASATINGSGEFGELTIGYFVGTDDETMDNLQVGLQTNTVIPGRLTLNNVKLGPIAWQIYHTTSASLVINNSTINEIGIVGNGSASINSSVLQLAILACYGQDSSLTLNNCDVWNQAIEADNNGKITLTGCNVYGSLFFAKNLQSVISINGGIFHDNPPVDTGTTMIDTVTGYPNYNPFRAPGPPQKKGPGTVTCTSVSGCNW